MKKLLGLILILILIIIFVEIGYLSFFSPKTSIKITNQLNTPTISLTTPTAIFKILSQNTTDIEGRTIIYESSIQGALSGFEGAGYTVGYFQELEDIKNSSDKILIIKRKDNNSTSKFRLVYEPTKYTASTIISKLAVENLDIIKAGSTSKAVMGMGAIKDFNNKLPSILKKEDVVVIQTIMPNGQTYKDTNQDIVANWIVVRRWKNNLDIN